MLLLLLSVEQIVPVQSPCACMFLLWVCPCRSPPPRPQVAHGHLSCSGQRRPPPEAGCTEGDHTERWKVLNIHFYLLSKHVFIVSLYLGPALVSGLYMKVQQEVCVRESRTFRSEDNPATWISLWVNITPSQVIVWDLTGAENRG